MMGAALSWLPRRWLQDALLTQWRNSLPIGDRVRFDHWGATGNAIHHPFAWADTLDPPTELRPRTIIAIAEEHRAVAEEREACALICDEVADKWDDLNEQNEFSWRSAQEAATLIRARNGK